MEKPLISTCVKKFLELYTFPDLAALYNPNMEVQIIVARGKGYKAENDFKGRMGDGFTDGINTWYPIRIPRNANKEPENNDREMPYNLIDHALGIGMTGWDFAHKVSRWVGYDFDALLGHSDRHHKKLTDAELRQIEDAVSDIPWVTVRRSTSGNGRHLYVHINPVRTDNHIMHSALARSVLGQLSAKAAFDFQSKVDALGGVLWQWHKKKEGTNGLELIKQGNVLFDIPENWKEHINVVTGKKKKLIPFFIENNVEAENSFLELVGQRIKVPFDSEHKKVIDYLQDNGYACVYNQDLHLVITHTYALKKVHSNLGLKGIFETLAEGSESGDHNCFMYAMRGGAWCIKRYTPGIAEASTWEQSKDGYTTCFFNKNPDLKIASKTYKGIEDTDGSFVFSTADEAQKAAIMLGTDLNLPSWANNKKAILKRHNDGRLVAKLECDAQKDAERGGIPNWNLKNKFWQKIFSVKIDEPSEIETANFDELIRHLISPTADDAGWTIMMNQEEWQNEPINHVSKVLKAMGYKHSEVEVILGTCISKSWRLTNIPFQPEYLGNRQWNRRAAQLRYMPLESKENLHYPTWTKMLTHLGKALDFPIKNNKWAKDNNITSGASYLKCWIASLFQFPAEPLPYLFFYGPENSGKSSFHEAIKLLVTEGVKRADTAVVSQGNFTSELENAILCIVEDKSDLKKNKQAFNRIKDWVTSPVITIHKKGVDPYDIPNTSHWCQTSNFHDFCPVFPGDTRITVVYVEQIDDNERILTHQFESLLKKEAPDFITEIMSLELPTPVDRLYIPVIITDEKLQIQSENLSVLETFIKDNCYYVEGEMIKFSEFYDRFVASLDATEFHLWSKKRVAKELPPQHPKGTWNKDLNQLYVGNISWTASANGSKKCKLITRENHLIPVG